ncbi:thioester-forming surface-anchored protein [Streptococcus equi subsp. zooepidemicus]|uniref:thioester-forming surface-anchored protein n=1 Tax=Streptococcus equi TaxID=1336 RepID=UPI0022AB8E29|nr:thioester-forming surface-anchored protein [Streptococcus equi]MDI6000919.1 thioester-forming surface-anchored protein [Streptococcus equi subsp. zooepidemicus]WOK53094.1 thioester-forming surface-anchored protein [Streptococcus equi subsp. zooepidemicus]WOK55040.1 thioester-forming surface-anchored protein [Streptococcus equi subsp. zooepidemicus]
MKTKSFRKVLTTSATCIVLATSFAGGTLRVWAEQLYYGWEDQTRSTSPFFLYATPQNDPKRELKNEFVVYCFNRNLHWPDLWQSGMQRPSDLPLYEKLKGTIDLFTSKAYKPRKVDDIEKTLVAVLSQGYPNVLSVKGLDANSSRKVTQLAIWYFSDSVDHPESVITEQLNEKEKEALYYLIGIGNNAKNYTSEGKTLNLYEYKSGGHWRSGYQHLLGSSLIPKIDGFGGQNHHKLDGLKGELPGLSGEAGAPEKPGTFGKNDKPLNGLEGGQPNLPESGGEAGAPDKPGTFGKNDKPLNGLEGGQPNSPELGGEAGAPDKPGTFGKNDKPLNGLEGEQPDLPGQTGGQGPIIETTEDTQKGMSGQSGGTIESENTKKPEVMIGGQGQTIETTEDTQKGMSGQSGGTIESEDTKKPEVMIGGQGQIIDFSENTQSGMSGQSGDTTVIEDTKKSEIIIGGQGQIIDFSEDTQPGMSGQSGDTTIVEDTKKPTPKPKPAPIVNDEKPNKGTQLPQTSEFKQLTLSIIGAMSMLLVLGLSLFKRPSKKD